MPDDRLLNQGVDAGLAAPDAAAAPGVLGTDVDNGDVVPGAVLADQWMPTLAAHCNPGQRILPAVAPGATPAAAEQLQQREPFPSEMIGCQLPVPTIRP